MVGIGERPCNKILCKALGYLWVAKWRKLGSGSLRTENRTSRPIIIQGSREFGGGGRERWSSQLRESGPQTRDKQPSQPDRQLNTDGVAKKCSRCSRTNLDSNNAFAAVIGDVAAAAVVVAVTPWESLACCCQSHQEGRIGKISAFRLLETPLGMRRTAVPPCHTTNKALAIGGLGDDNLDGALQRLGAS